ncbi:hypothetical protein CPU12_12045 [Malaciobacter molluscorum LMG 25693]|uniref:Membrane protein n=1 Tax=Malaciobacter molluscorum LMG 25693 TaxID=870501 RepID=A0A2G1DF57_9BACT|nr:hypothetical protein [Malaciobacter molluscorum]AXX91269.1 putative membrane protein [Malaciobacter molluscorum LMG 25693]PHO17142.1 hypothetical protein CPU12_12045 [Malaciobacter molluscorum LMG 25693]
MKVLLLLLIFLQLCFSNIEFTNKEKPVFQEEPYKQLNTQNEEETFSNALDYLNEKDVKEVPTSKNLYLSYIEFPENIYKNQRFEVVLKALITTDDFDRIETRFVDSKNMNVLNPEEPWMAVDKNSFENRYFFKAYEEDFILPTFQVLLYKDDRLVDFAYLKSKDVRFSKLAQGDSTFSNVIAKELTVNTHKTKQYNNKELLTILDIDAKDSNLEDFYLKEFSKDQGISSIEDNYPNQHILYYVVAPIYDKKLEFTYFNTKSNSFKTISIPLSLENELVSTQTDLNPNNSNYELYKKIALLVILLIFLILLIWKRKFLYLVIVLILIALSILYLMPNRKVSLKKDTMVYILPTNKSTVFYQLKNSEVVEILNSKREFKKVMFDDNGNKIIGWVKEKNIGKN